MASNVLADLATDFLECSICVELYHVPKLLPCGHTFCRECINKWIETQGSRAIFSCPKCRTDTFVPDGGLNAFKDDKFVLNLLSFHRVQVGIHDEVEWLNCASCSEQVGQSSCSGYCHECKGVICKPCGQHHKTLAALRGHTVVDEEELKSSNIQELYQRSQPEEQCSQHKGETRRLFCQTCEIIICQVCCLIAHPRPKHSVYPVSETADRVKKELTKDLDSVCLTMKRIEKKMEDANHIRERLTSKIDSSKQAAFRRCEEVIKKVNEEFHSIIKHIDKVGGNRLKVIDAFVDNTKLTLGKVKGSYHLAQRQVDLCTDRDILMIGPELRQMSKNLKGETVGEVDSNFGTIVFESNKIEINPLLGKLITTSYRWRLKKTFGQLGKSKGEFMWAYDVIVTPDSDIAVCDPKLKRIQIFNEVGKYKFSLEVGKDEKDGTKEQMNVSITNDDKYIVAQRNSKWVKQYTFDGKCFCKFSPDETLDGRYASLESVSVSPRGLICIGQSTPIGTVYLHDKDGTIIWKRNYSQPWFIAFNSLDQIAVRSKDGINILSSEAGDMIKKITLPIKEFDLRGVCFDSKDNLYVVDNKGKTVHKFNQEWNYCGKAVIGLNDPYGITFSNEGRMYICDHDDVKVMEWF
ncbi:uncharacterized protein [Antedon mediterranea]|uniref:uncharacterized protein n=1 Tax=Antedon mediterranea TaxID=105859 RepID=UPI003AF8664B